MAEIKVEGKLYDPYYILDVTHDDSTDIISKKYRQKIKFFHPDKYTHKISKTASAKERADFEKKRVHHMLVLNEAYDYILTKKENKPVSRGLPTRIDMPARTYSDLNTDASNDRFNEVFMKNRGVQAHDFGYGEHTRLQSVDDYKELDYKPPNLFNDRSFSSDEFNKMFELNKQLDPNESDFNGALIHQTSDGFSGFNGGGTDGFAQVSSFNGLLLAGDNLGQSGQGYYDIHYSDYKKTFATPKNPSMTIREKLATAQDPDHSRYNTDLASELEKRLMERDTPIHREHTNFKQAGVELNKKQMGLLKSKVTNDKEFIMQYKHNYPEYMIDDAIERKLVTNVDYVGNVNTSLTWEENLGGPSGFLG